MPHLILFAGPKGVGKSTIAPGIVRGASNADYRVENMEYGKQGKDSGIANDWGIETMHIPRYPLELFMRVVTVSLATKKIVNRFPKLEILDKKNILDRS